MPDFSSLADLTKAPPDEGLSVLDQIGTRETTVVCFDQSLTNTGLVVMRRFTAGLRVISSRTLRPVGVPAGNSGFETDFARALSMEVQMEQVLTGYQHVAQHPLVVHEMPAVGSRRLPGAGNSSKMAALSLRSAARILGISEHVRMVNSQKAKKIVCGNAKADKKEAHAALTRDILSRVPGGDLVTNEHERDAVMVGLAALLADL